MTKQPIVLPDSSTIYSILYWQRQETRLFKLYPDGRLAGRDVSVEEPGSNRLPSEFRIARAWPNPFNNTVSIELELSGRGEFELVFTNILGQEVDRLTVGAGAPIQIVDWRPGDGFSGGVYFIHLHSGPQSSKPIKVVYLP